MLSAIVLVACSSDASEKKPKTAEPKTEKNTKVETEEDYFDIAVDGIEKITTDNYNSDDYYILDYRTILRDPENFFATKLRIDNFEIIQVSEEGKYTKLLGMQPNNDIYMLFIETERADMKFLEGDTLTVNGRYILTYDYKTTTGTENSVPLIYTDAYLLLN